MYVTLRLQHVPLRIAGRNIQNHRHLFVNRLIVKIKEAFNQIDWKLLVFLLLFLNVKIVVKIAAVLLLYIFQSNVKFGFRWRNSRLPLFYVLMPAIGILNYFILSGITSGPYTLVVMTGLVFWILCILAIHQIKLSVDGGTPAVIHNTVIAFYIINAIISLGALIGIIVKTGRLNPYLYQGEFQLYFIGTGDFIKGLSFDTSTTNAVLNALGVIYFLNRRNAPMSFLCMSILLLTGSNVTNMILGGALLFVFLFQSDRDQKSLIVICLFLLVIFMAKVSPQNDQYLANTIKKYFAGPTQQASINVSPNQLDGRFQVAAEEQRTKEAIQYLDSLSALKDQQLIFTRNKLPAVDKMFVVPADDINMPEFQHQSFSTPVERSMNQFIKTHGALLPISADTAFRPSVPGKLIAWRQSVDYLLKHPIAALLGTGMGNFSSKLAFRTTGLKIDGSWPSKYPYINKAFLENHLDLYLFFFSKTDGFHSTIHSPASVYDQVITEYGMAGITCFFIFYAGYFLRKSGQLSYGIPLMSIVFGTFFFDYWFEQLSVVVFFELLMFLKLKEREVNNG